MANKVSPQADGTEEFPAIYGTTCTSLDPEYLKAKERVGEHYCTLPDGRKLCYTKDGNSDDPLVICMHGGCEGKWKFIQRSPIDGVFLVSIDRPGYGNSDPGPPGYGFDAVAKDIKFLAKDLGFAEFIISGHSIGGHWAQQIAAALPDSVRGAILWSAVCDLTTSKAAPFIKAVGRPPSALHPTKGCCGCILKSSFTSYVGKFQKYDYKEGLSEESKHGPTGFSKYKSDMFWISSTVDSWKSFKDPNGILIDANISLFADPKNPGHQDVEQIKCPVYVYHGDKDFDMGTKAPGAIDYYKALYPNAVVETIEGYAHVCTIGPNPETQERFKKAVKNMPSLASSAPPQQEMKD
eukprot:gnl/MRDRNA2_/MRDRNA2_59587_c0_seq1.p1 gnl/MRDRNA2_/MRDRNA2_59587_c0~~gnl/MRDRNA2_/MRDRNA2_59587_c0_seq1.p1  ORF type:complete len:351 (+),score=66.57 gnl/MRDRNA2_/MRDRNA2_59587_c0_seq1:82-1134(+)